MHFLVTDEQIQAAFDYLDPVGEGTESAAQARADFTLAEYRVKSTRAKLILEAPKALGTAALRQAWAESHEDYIRAYEVEAKAVGEWEIHVRMRVWAESTRDAWRTQEANSRGVNRF